MKKLVVLVCMMAVTAFGQYASKLRLLTGADVERNSLIGVLDTNILWLSGSLSNEANGWFYWNEGSYYTNASDSILFIESTAWNLTNATWAEGDYYQAESGYVVGVNSDLAPYEGIVGAGTLTVQHFTNGLGGDFASKFASYNSPTNYDELLQIPFAVRSQTVGAFLSMVPDYALSTTAQVTLQKSYDKTNWQSALVFNVTGTGPSVVGLGTNLTIGEFGWLRVYNITNLSSTPARSLFLELYHK